MDRQLLARATENSDAPTPGYMYLDIAKNAASNPQTCSEIAKYLTGRLASKNNSNIKYKCLKVIAKTAVSPYLRGQFKRCLAQDPQSMAAIKDATQFRGPPDPVRGDEPYEKVRNAAKEALDAVYSDTPAGDPSGGGTSFATSVSSGYGPSAGSSYGGGPPPGGRRMEGIGNPMFKDPRLEPQPQGIGNMTVNDLVNEAKSTVIGIIKDPLARNVDISLSNRQGSMPRPGGSYSGPTAGAYNRPPPGRSEIMHQTNGEWTMASNRGPGAVAPPPNYANDSAYYKSRDAGNSYSWAQSKGGAAPSGVGGVWATAPAAAPNSTYGHQATPSITVNNAIGGVVHASGGGGTAVSDGSYEKQLIMELCPPGGMKPEPPPDKLAQFARLVSGLNADLVCPVLLDCLEEGQPWIIRAKALWVMLSCIQNGQKPGATNNPYADFFHACSGEIAPLANHTRAAIREPAKRVLNSLGVATPVEGAPPIRSTMAPTAPPPAPVANLLDFDEGDAPEPAVTTPTTAPPHQPPPVPPPTAPASNGSLFGGLNVASVPSTGPPTEAAPLTAAAPTAPTGESLLDFMTAETPAPAAAPAASSFGFLNGGDSAPQAAASVTSEVKQASSMFDSLSLKGNQPSEGEKKAAEASLASASPVGSAFGFINSVGSSDASDKKADAPAAVADAVSRDSFDPLKNATPISQKKMMQLSQEQVQAMYYQQMMMQQQMQMAQMQMALQQQAKRGSAGNQQMFMNMPGRVMQNPAASKSTFAFMDKPQKPENHSFDFVKDAMTNEKKK